MRELLDCGAMTIELTPTQITALLVMFGGAIVWLVRVTLLVGMIKFKVDLMWDHLNNHLDAGLKEPKFTFVKARD